MSTTAEQLAAYKAQVDARYARGYSARLSPAQERRAELRRRREEDRSQPDWLLYDANGKIDGFHVYSRDIGWDTEENVWRKFFPRKREREQLQAEGWTVVRDDFEGTGRAAFARQQS